MGRLEVETYEDGATVRYAYDNSGNLATVTDSATGVVTTYYYDLLNRQSGYREQGTNYDHSVTYTYDAENNLSSMTEVIDGVTKTYSYTYDEYNKLISETVDGITVEYTYDGFGRLEERVVKNGTTEIYSIEPSYSAGTGNIGTSTQIASYNGFTYTYDDNGNILSVNDGTNTTTYVYDSQNQLLWEYNEAFGFAHHWEYDEAGNIRKRTEHDYFNGEISEAQTTFEYQYNYSQWRDLLTLCNNEDRLSDALGNLTDDEEWEYTWKHGRQLASMSDGNTTWTYTYDANGMRTRRTDGMTIYTYVYNGSQLVRLIVDTNELFDFYFTYDATGTPLTVTENGYTYYYVTNLQGDVIGIKDSSGNQVVSYAYDAWGKLLYRTNTQLAEYNPLRYRGYVYDWETGLYYLQSRYYNPEWGRFINADIFYSTGQGFIGNNMFAYCGNNPVLNIDESGTMYEISAGGGGVPSFQGNFSPKLRDVTEEVDTAVNKVVDDLKQYEFNGRDLHDAVALVLKVKFFYDFFPDTGPWGIKYKNTWEKTIGTEFPGGDTYVLYHGIKMKPEDIGNFTYGMIGYASGLPLDLLLLGSSWNAGSLDTPDQIAAEQIDRLYIIAGYEYY